MINDASGHAGKHGNADNHQRANTTSETLARITFYTSLRSELARVG